MFATSAVKSVEMKPSKVTISHMFFCILLTNSSELFLDGGVCICGIAKVNQNSGLCFMITIVLYVSTEITGKNEFVNNEGSFQKKPL